MKTRLVVIGLSGLVGLTGCSSVPYSYPNSCTASHLIKTPCGPCIVDRCQYVCKTCKFNGPTCQACFMCINRDKCEDGTCGVNYP